MKSAQLKARSTEGIDVIEHNINFSYIINKC
jgi:hypothetical protein